MFGRRFPARCHHEAATILALCLALATPATAQWRYDPWVGLSGQATGGIGPSGAELLARCTDAMGPRLALLFRGEASEVTGVLSLTVDGLTVTNFQATCTPEGAGNLCTQNVPMQAGELAMLRRGTFATIRQGDRELWRGELTGADRALGALIREDCDAFGSLPD